MQYIQAFLFIAIKFNTASCFLSQRSFEEESTSMLFFSVCCALPKNTVPICFLFCLFLSFYFHDECMYKKKTLRLNDQWWFAKAETRIFSSNSFFFSYTLFSKISTGNLSFCFFSQPFGRELDSPSEIYKCIVPKSQYKKKAEQKV